MGYSTVFGLACGQTNLSMGEFGLIQQFFRDACQKANALDHPLALGIGDDAAILAPVPEGHQIVMTTDTLVEGRHYWADVDPQSLGHKVLAVSLSDLAAMGAKPWAFTLSVALRSVQTEWLAAFMRGMSALADRYRIDLVGGDTVGLAAQVSSAESFSVTALGLVPQGRALRRDGLQPGDRIWVSGDLGDGQWAVRHSLRARKLLWPEPRLDLGLALQEVAHAAIDVSDGLSSELSHMVVASRGRSQIPLWVEVSLPALSGCLGGLLRSAIAVGQIQPQEACRDAAGSGDEYELVFSASDQATPAIQAISARLGLPLTPIGWVRQPMTHGPDTDWPTKSASVPAVQNECLVWHDREGRRVSQDQAPARGFDHFAVTR
jgi:thiamine-monophosphate kinase